MPGSERWVQPVEGTLTLWLCPPMAQATPSVKVQSSDATSWRPTLRTADCMRIQWHPHHPSRMNAGGALLCQALILLRLDGKRSGGGRGSWGRSRGTEEQAPWRPQAAANYQLGQRCFNSSQPAHLYRAHVLCVRPPHTSHNSCITRMWGWQGTSPAAKVGGTNMGKGGGTQKEKGPSPIFVSPDVDECSFRPPVCHNSTVCVNTVGSYRCHCRRGWELKPGFQNKQMNTTCQGSWSDLTPAAIPTHTQTLSHLINGCFIACRDVLPCLDRTPWNQEPGGWPQQGPGGRNPSVPPA